MPDAEACATWATVMLVWVAGAHGLGVVVLMYLWEHNDPSSKGPWSPGIHFLSENRLQSGSHKPAHPKDATFLNSSFTTKL